MFFKIVLKMLSSICKTLKLRNDKMGVSLGVCQADRRPELVGRNIAVLELFSKQQQSVRRRSEAFYCFLIKMFYKSTITFLGQF